MAKRNASGKAKAGVREFPVCGLHISTGHRGDLDLWEKFIREALPKEGVNTFVMEINYGYDFKSWPAVAEQGALTKEEVKRLLGACRDAGVELIPQVNCLGHQSWAGHSHGLLRAFPEFDERLDIPQDADSKALYCRSYCPAHPKVHDVLFALLDEVADAFEARQFHIGMDEVFLIAEEKCPRCRGKSAAELFAGEVTALHDHLARRGLTTWMWGDRFINSAEFPTGIWEGSGNNTWGAVDRVPTDIVVCDWHYERAFDTPQFFAAKGFPVLASPWNKPEAALAELEIMRKLRKKSDKALGMLQTTWCGFDSFVHAYYGDLPADNKRNEHALGAAECFKTLFAALRGETKEAP
jgi:hypothetical protein